MGMCLPCLNSTADDYNQPSPEERRRQQAEAAERRRQEQEGRGVKDAEALRRKQQKRDEMERRAASQGDQSGPLRVNLHA
ncbi:hypothetical protein BaRGS_00011491 [Batillaria attramentaria]|uniref:Small VCP/p97-interacting protein n=1 Tax=Batillaria attramentaria TaxID=370345 RepID=A0ABD0LD20_9CAEN